MQTSYGTILLSIVGGQPQVLNLKQVLVLFLEHRREVINRRTAFELKRAEERLHLLAGFKIAIDNLDAVIKLREVSDHDATRGAQFVVTFTKCRSAFGDEVKDFETRIEDQDGTLIWTWKDVEESNETRLINLIHDGIDNVRDAAVEMDVTPGYISKIKKKLVAKGTLKAGRTLALADGASDWDEI